MTARAFPAKPFWMVYGIGQREPTRQHPSREIAQEEAKRLARECPGVAFVVLEAIGAVVKDDLRTVIFKAPDAIDRSIEDEIPF